MLVVAVVCRLVRLLYVRHLLPARYRTRRIRFALRPDAAVVVLRVEDEVAVEVVHEVVPFRARLDARLPAQLREWHHLAT